MARKNESFLNGIWILVGFLGDVFALKFVETETREEEEEEEKKRKTDENALKTDEQNSESLSQVNDPLDDLLSS